MKCPKCDLEDPCDEDCPWGGCGFSAMQVVLDAPVVFGLRAQGKLDQVGHMLAVGKSWGEITDVIGWEQGALKRHWEMEKQG